MFSIKDYKNFHQMSEEFALKIKFFCVFGHNDNEVIFVTKDDNVFAFGDNYYGCLGLGHNNRVNKPNIVKELCGQQIIDISCGYHYVIALTKSGKCFSWGYNYFGNLGNLTQTDNYKPLIINALMNKFIIQISCGECHSLVLTNNNELLAFGYNSEGEIGCGDNSNHLKPIKIIGFVNEKVVAISCGRFHTLMLTESGRVLSWGFNAFGQLGINNKTHQNIPTQVILSNNVIIKSISCGQYHSLLLSTDGEVYAFGSNTKKQLGKVEPTEQLIPMKLNNLPKFKEICAHWSSHISIALTEDYKCYVWGECKDSIISAPQKTQINSINKAIVQFSKQMITFKPVFLIKSKHSSNPLIEKLSNLFNNPEDSDIRFKIEGKLIFAHKCILKMSCNYFKLKFNENTNALIESTEHKYSANEIEVKEYSYDVYYAFLKYVYTNEVEIETEKAIDLLVLANNYGESELKDKCLHIIENGITIENVCALYCTSFKYKLPKLQNKFCEFSANKMNYILKTESFRKMDSISKNQFLERTMDID